MSQRQTGSQPALNLYRLQSSTPRGHRHVSQSARRSRESKQLWSAHAAEYATLVENGSRDFWFLKTGDPNTKQLTTGGWTRPPNHSANSVCGTQESLQWDTDIEYGLKRRGGAPYVDFCALH
eukprot:SAG31_NODE_3180_length_4582_cov_2.985501_3_plen_122_part_00